MNLINSLNSEWLKTKRSAASWLCLIGGFFIPLIFLIISLVKHNTINSYGTNVNIWEAHFTQLWQNMSSFLLPMGVILASSLITQIEYKNNTWKQLFATPQTFTNIYISKFLVILIMIIKFFVFFNIGIVLSGIIPSLLFDGHFPNQNIPFLFFIKENIKYFLTCLPIIAIQYLISLNFKNFLIPVGIGLLGLIGSLIGLSWKYIYISPFSYCAMTLVKIDRGFNIYGLAIIYFILIMIVGHYLFITKKVKG